MKVLVEKIDGESCKISADTQEMAGCREVSSQRIGFHKMRVICVVGEVRLGWLLSKDTTYLL